MALQGHLASVKVQSSGVVMTDEAATTSDNLTYQITDTAKRYIDLNTAVVVEDSAVVTTENYTVNYLTGEITFAETGTRTITVSGAYMTPSTVATAKSYSVNVTADTLENTVFTDTFKTFQSGLVSGTASLGRFHASDDLFIDEILAGNYFIVEFFVDATNKVSFYGLPSSNTVDAAVESLVEENVDFQITNNIEV